MIAWKEVPPDFRRRPVDELLAVLPFTVACAVMLYEQPLPRVLAPRSVLNSIWSHLRERRVEMGGLLIGKVYDVSEFGLHCIHRELCPWGCVRRNRRFASARNRSMGDRAPEA